MKKKLILIALTLVLSLTTIMACVRPTGDESTFRIAFDMQREWEDEFGFSYPQVALLVRRELAKSNPSFVNAVVSMVESSVDFARENAGETARLVRNELNVAGMPQTNIIETFILGSGQDVFNFQNATESRESVNTFLTELHAVNPQSVGGRLPTDEFYFNPENGDDVGEISGQFSFFVPAGAPMIAAAHMFHYQPRVQYDQREIEFDFQMVMPPQLMSAVNGGLADFAIAPINLAAQRFNAMGNNYVIAGIVMWGLLHIVENYERTGGVNSLEGLVGETIFAFQRNASPGVVLTTILIRAGLEVNWVTPESPVRENAVNIVELTTDAEVLATMLGRRAAIQDARFALLAEPFVTELTMMSSEDIGLE